ncbi:hypothetical protein [Hoeflea olei]|uniref:hypothetical protein n=1 Tax=Hoeflea olei TaxID=1480615 RepID=UPI0011125E4A|nr:hypothetical protein [Hoeflea olei]
MSYYDHATMMALRLGPWADPHAAHPATRQEELRPGADPASKARPPVASLFRAACRRVRFGRARPDAAARPDGDARQKT